MKVENWVFYGPQTFLDLVQESIDLIEKEDPLLFEELFRRKHTCIYYPKELVCMPEWGCLGISDDYIAWKTEGVVVALIYFHWRISEDWSRGRWYFTNNQNVKLSRNFCQARTNEWIKAHDFPPELLIET